MYNFTNTSVFAKPALTPPIQNRVITGTVIKVLGANQVQIKYIDPVKKLATPVITKNAHNMKLNEAIEVTVKPTAPYAFVSIAKKAVPKPPAPNLVIAGTVIKVLSANQVQIKYTDPAKKLATPVITKNAHNMKFNEAIDVTVKPTAPYAFVSIAKKAVPKPPVPQPPIPNRTIIGTVIKVLSTNQVQIKYTDPAKKLATHVITKNAQNMKINEAIEVSYTQLTQPTTIE